MRFSVTSSAVGQLLAVSSLLNGAIAQTAAELTALELEHAYGGSPPVYPTPEGVGLGDWASAYAQAKALVAQMTNEEKQNITIGYSSTTNGCSGNSPGVSRLGYPGMCLNDAGNGPRGFEGASGYPSGVHVGASWNRNLTFSRGYYMGAEFKAKGVNMALGPVVGPLGRVATGGRNWEGFSNDPYLGGALVYETISAMQESVIACVKHFIGNEQETNRNPIGNNASISSNLDDKTLHEAYLWPFQEAVRAGAGAVMCSYNRINGSYACQNSKTINGVLKTELAFQGLVVSDWGAQHTGIASANSGLDMVMPSSVYWTGNLTLGVANGTLAQSRLDDMATRIVATYLHLAPLTAEGAGVPVSETAAHTFVNARDPASASTIFQGAVEGHVLVKNTNNVLPLSKPGFLSLFGYDGIIPAKNNPVDLQYDFGYEVLPINNSEVFGLFFSTNSSGTPRAAYAGTLSVGGGSGANSPPYISAPYDAFAAQAKVDGTWLAWDFVSQDPAVNGAEDACIVFINEFSSEGFDRQGLADPYSDTLVLNVAAKCNNTIVVIHNAGIRLVDAFYSHPNVTAIIYAHLPGQDSGSALVELMYGRQAPSGRLPYTVAKKESDYGDLLYPTVPSATSDYYTASNFTEGVFIDYKAFIQADITPRFGFGYGLTYTTFSFSGIHVTVPSSNLSSTAPAAPATIGGNPHLWDVIATVTVNVANTGSVSAAAVPQLYVGIPYEPKKQLRGFEKGVVAPGARTTFSFELTRKDLSVWDVVRQDWVLQSGEYVMYIGDSVMHTPLQRTVELRCS